MANGSTLPAPIPSRLPASKVGRQAPPAKQSPFAPILVWRAIVRWWRVATPLAIVLAVLSSGLVWLTFEKQFRASAWLQIQETPTHLAYPAQDNPRRFVQNQIELLKSSLVLGPVVARPEIAGLSEIRIADDPILFMAGRLRVDGVGESELFEISYRSSDASASARVVNAVVESYLRLRSDQDTTRNTRMLELLEEEKNLRLKEVTRMRQNVRELSKQVLGKDPFTGAPGAEVVVVNRPLDQLMGQLTTAEVERKVLEMQLSAFDRATSVEASELPPAIIEGALDRHPSVQEIKALLSGKQAMLGRVEEASANGAKDPAYRRVAQDIKRLEDSLKRTKASLRGTVLAELVAEAELKQGEDFAQLQTNLELKRATESSLREQYQKLLRDAGQTGSQSLDLEFARAELAREEKVFELIAQRALALRTEMRAPNRVTPMKAATVPLLPIERFPLKLWLMAMAASLSAPFGLAVLWEGTLRRICDAEQIGQEASIRVVGEVSRLPLRSRRLGNAALTHHDLSLFEESVDSLRTGLVLGDEHKDVRVIAVASAVSSEGKTSVAAQLAVSIARATGQKTLLVDADLRSPDVHRVFHLEGSPGLADVLEGRAALDEAINTAWSDVLHVLPAGHIGANPHAVVNNGMLPTVLEEAKGRYSFVVIDTPPVLLASEALVVASLADGTLLCTMRDYSREGQVKSATERLRSAGIRLLGAVLSGIPARQYASKYGTYPYSRYVS